MKRRPLFRARRATNDPLRIELIGVTKGSDRSPILAATTVGYATGEAVLVEAETEQRPTVLGLIASVVGVVVGAIAGYFRGVVDAILMRITDVFIVIPALVIGSVVGHMFGGLGAFFLALMLGFFSWMGIARLVRGEFLSLREREFVEAARVAGASDMRIIFKHILPNAIGVVIVASTLIMASAILLETALSFLGFGIRPPDVSLGLLISSNESAFQTRPWLFWWPGAFIVTLALLVNFVGDGLRDAFDPRHRRFNLRKMREQEPEEGEGDGGSPKTGAALAEDVL